MHAFNKGCGLKGLTKTGLQPYFPSKVRNQTCPQECFPSFPGNKMVLAKDLSNGGSQILQNSIFWNFSPVLKMFGSCDLAIKAIPSCIIGMKGSIVVVHWCYES